MDVLDGEEMEKIALPIRDQGGSIRMMTFDGEVLKKPYSITEGGKTSSYSMYREGKTKKFLVYKASKPVSQKADGAWWSSQFFLRDTIEQCRDVVPGNVLDAWYPKPQSAQGRLF